MTYQSSHSSTCWATLFLAVALMTGALGAPGTVRASGPGDCSNDSKLLNGGPTLVYGDTAGTWWALIEGGLNAAGLDTEQEQIDYLNGIFGTNYSDLNSLKTFNLQQVSTWDKNGNGYVCAYDLRGTRAYLRDPFSEFTYFGISDDKIAKK